MNLSSEIHSLECRSLSYMSTLAGTGSWFSRIYRPPLVAQFLKDVSLTAHSGEVHGVIGVAGSGKSTLLDVVSLRALGDIGGTVLLDKHLLTVSRFSKLCVYVSFLTRYPGKMTVRTLLYYHARLSIGNATTTVEDIERMVDQSLENFDLLGYSDEWMETLSESARRRTILALQLISDPLLVIIDDFLRGLDPLPSFQLMSCLSVWAKRKNRIVLVSMRTPRSDIYQLLNRLTILYYGEIFYSGFTKQLPAYFKHAGFTCPSNENPAVYYLSLATVDRETSDRYSETQEQAVKLVEHFKVHSVTPRDGDISKDSLLPMMPIGSSVALCYLERPGNMAKMNTLIRRTLTHSLSQWPILVARFFLLPFLLFTLLSVIAFNTEAGSPSLPFSVAGSIHLAICITASTSILLGFASFHPLRTLLYIESTEDVYVGALPVIAYLIVNIPIEMVSVALAAMLWLAGPSSVLWLLPSPSILLIVVSSLPLLMATAAFSHALIILLLCFIRSSLTAISLSFAIITTSIVHAGGFIRQEQCASLGVEWLLYCLFCHLSLRQRLSGLLSSRSYPITGHGAIVKPGPEGFVYQVMGMASIFPSPRMRLFWLGPKPALMLYSPEFIEKIVTKRELNKGFAYDLLHPWLGLSLLTSEKEEWRPRRKMLTPTFHYDILKDFLPIFNQHARILIQKMNQVSEGTPMEVLHTISLCALDAICETSMGKTVNAQQETDSEYVRAIADINEIVQNRTKNPLAWSDFFFNLTSDGKRHKQCLEILHGFTRKVIDERLEEMRVREWRLEGRLAFLDLLLHMWNEGTMEWQDIQPEVDTFMFEGHDTTATALTWTLHLIGNDEDVQRRIHEEIDSVFVGDEISVDDLGKLKYLECCVKRRYLLNIYVAHSDSNHWDDPKVFRPERFLPENSARHAYSFVPFSAGSRNWD